MKNKKTATFCNEWQTIQILYTRLSVFTYSAFSQAKFVPNVSEFSTLDCVEQFIFQ